MVLAFNNSMYYVAQNNKRNAVVAFTESISGGSRFSARRAEAPLLSTGLETMLRSARWAGALTSEELDGVCREAQERRVPAGAHYVRAGTPCDFWVGVIEGLGKMTVSLPDGCESTFTAVSAGGWFGEGTLFKGERWRYDAIAIRDSRLALVPRATFERLLHTSLPFTHFILSLLNARLSLFIGLAVFDRLLGVDTRVARCLATLFDPDLYPRTSCFLKLSQSEIGLLSGVSRQRANKALHALERAGLMRIEFGCVTVLDVPGLWRFIGDPDPGHAAKDHGPKAPRSAQRSRGRIEAGGSATASSPRRP
jgi:CRP-like cAMP-binding protein